MVGDGDFGGVFESDFVFICFEGVGRQVFDQVIIFYVVNGCVLVEVFEGFGQFVVEGIGGVVLQVFGMVGVIYIFDEVEVFNGGVIFGIEWQVVEEVWQGQVDIV